ncbi:hypothetical protein V6Z11_A04G061400 [Gossypium hirsutum]
MVQLWNPAYSCFIFGEVDLVPTLEEYTTLLRCPKIQGNKVYVRAANLPTFVKKLMMITGVSEQWAAAQIQQKGDRKCIPWASLRDLILTHPDVKKRVDVLALSIYGLLIFPKAIGHIDKAFADLFDRLSKQNMPMPAILAETFRSLSACRRASECRFIGCVQLLLVWEAAVMPRRDNITEERWIEILQNLREEDLTWKSPWMAPNEILYCYGSFDWIPLPGIWGVVGYAPLLVLRQYKAEQFIPATQGLAQSDFPYKGDHYKKKMQEIFEAWKKTCCVKILTEEVQEERAKAEYWEKKFQEMQARNQALEKENQGLKTKVTELGRSLHHHRSRNSAVELKASQDKIEEMKHNIGRLEATLQDCELRIE